jgi:hypothetical protein
MELDETTKARLVNIETEVLNHLFEDTQADGVLDRDSPPLEGAYGRTKSMLN